MAKAFGPTMNLNSRFGVVASVLLLSLPLAGRVSAQNAALSLAEAFALAPDRSKVLAQLLPGTEDYYFYRCLDAQHRGDFAAVPPLLQAWVDRHGRNERIEELERRQALLCYDGDPLATFAFLRERLKLTFDAQRTAPGAKPDLPTSFDLQLLQKSALDQRALSLHPNSLDGFRQSAVQDLAGMTLTDPLLTPLLMMVKRPDVPGLVNLIVRQLRQRDSGGFGSLPIHRGLTLSQYDDLARAMPELLGASIFVNVYAARLLPSQDVDWQRDTTARAAYLDRLWAFAQRLPSAQNGFKVHVLAQRLSNDLLSGTLDKERFLAYLRLPRPVGYLPAKLRELWQRRGEPFVSGEEYSTSLPVWNSDEELVRAYLEPFLATEDSYEPYREWLEDGWLRRVFVEQQLLAGKGDAERAYSLLADPGFFEQLKERVEIRFMAAQQRHFASDTQVAIDVDVKNVPTLLVKVFAIDAYAYQRDKGREVDASIDLDGLFANHEMSFTYDEPPLRRVRRHFDLPQVASPGTYVVEFIGNGQSSRAVIVKGHLQFTERRGAAGQVLTVRDEHGARVAFAKAWFLQQEFTADEKGEINLPFGTQDQSQPIVLQHGQVSSLLPLWHRAETYELAAGFFVDREALIADHAAKVLVRPLLRLAGQSVSLSLLEQPELLITALDLDGTPTTRTVRDLQFGADGELVQVIQVPDRLARLTIVLRGVAQSLSLRTPVTLTSEALTLDLNRIDTLADTTAVQLGKSPAGWHLDLLGKNGEPKAERAVNVQLVLRDYTDPLEVKLKSDARGRIQLGELVGASAITVTGLKGGTFGWPLHAGNRQLPSLVTGIVGRTVRVPYAGRETTATRAVCALFEMVNDSYVSDRFDRLALQDGYLEMRELPAGDFLLWLKESDQSIHIAITAAKADGNWAFGSTRWLPEIAAIAPQISELKTEGNALLVRLANASKAARVHVFATHYLPAWSPQSLEIPQPASPGIVTVLDAESDFRSGRQLGDEFRYILDRRYAKKYPGNLLKRPGLLINPWALDDARGVAEGQGAASGKYGGSGARPNGMAPGSPAPIGTSMDGGSAGSYANVDFLPQAAPLLANLLADANGRIVIPLADLGQGQMVQVVYIDGEQTICRTTTLPERAWQPRARQLQNGLDPAQHFTQQRRIEFVAAGGTAVIDDVATAQTQAFGSLADVFRLFTAASKNPDLAEFAFVLRWPQLSAIEQRKLYSEHSCHELNVFLKQKDPKFFTEVVRPYLANKLDPTFIDHWLLEANLAQYLQPWAFAQLNVVEQILLLQRLPGQRESGVRLMRDRQDLIKKDVSQLDVWFKQALQSDSLERESLSRLAAEPQSDKAGAPAEKSKEALIKAFAASPNDPATGGPGGGGGGEGGGRGLREERFAAAKDRSDEGKDLKLLSAGILSEQKPGQAKNGEMDEMFLGATRSADNLSDLGRRKQVMELYREPEVTRQYAENNYWHRRRFDQGASLITINEFWHDFAVQPAGEPFCSSHFALVTNSFAEMMLALAMLDLPLALAEPTVPVRDGSRATYQTALPMLLVRQEIRPAQPAATQADVLLSQNFFCQEDRFQFENGERSDRFVTGEFLVGVIYGCQVVLTNPTSMPRKLDLLLQIPRGAVPVQRGFMTRGMAISLEAYATSKIEYLFYFPAAGEFAHFPAHVAKDGALIASANVQPKVLHVVDLPTEVDTQSWERVSQDGSADEVLAFILKTNLGRVDLSRLSFRLRDLAFFQRLTVQLRARHHYDHGVWSYALWHGAPLEASEWLQHADEFVQQCGPSLRSPLLTVDPIARGTWQQIEFLPVFHARAHQRGRNRVILNEKLSQQYQSLLSVLCHLPRLGDEDWLRACYYLLLQDRIEEAVGAFARVQLKGVPSRLQYDYLACYLDLFTDSHALARGIAEPYRDYPIEHWRNLFRGVLSQLDEAEGKAIVGDNLASREQRQSELAAKQPMLEMVLAGGKVTVRHKNLPACEVRYFRMDVEFSFSTNPFVQDGSGSYAWVKPQRADTFVLAADQAESAFAIPAEFLSQNVLIEVRGGGLLRRQTAFASALAVQTIENYGQLLVTDTASKQPLAKVYVKVYARMPGGDVKFHKDGYTDPSGRFDYASVSEPATIGAVKYSLLVLSEQSGAVIKEVAPPQR